MEGGGEGQGTTLLTLLAAHGVLRNLFGQETCPSCGQPISREAAYRCQNCQNLRHVRCHPLTGAGAPSVKCFLCQEREVFRAKGPQQANGLIFDVMDAFET